MRSEKTLFWDNFKGILIILVVFAHFLWAYYSCNEIVGGILKFIYFFHMPLFIFVSGYLSKSENVYKIKSFNKLLLYYVIFNTLMMLYLFITSKGSIDFVNSFNSYWYIIAIVLMRVSIKKVENVKFIIPLSIVIALLCGLYSWHITGIAKCLSLYPFFLIGYKFEKKKMDDIINNKSFKKYLIGFIFLIALIIISYFVIKNISFTKGMLTFGKYTKYTSLIKRGIIFFISSIALVSFICLIPNKKIPFISNWGRNSLYIYVTHRFVTLVFSKVFILKNFNNMYYIYAIICTIICLFIFGSNFMKKITDYLIDKLTYLYEKNKERTILIFLLIFILLMLIKPIIKLSNYIF